MRNIPYDLEASKQTVEVSQVAEQAVAEAHSKKRAEVLAAEIEADLAAAAEYADQHGASGDFVRPHYARDDGAV
jgi:post-segregation antitoxin (ccd killing protein)